MNVVVLLASTKIEQEHAHERGIASNAHELTPSHQRKDPARRERRSVSSGWNDTSSVLILDISMLTSRERARADRDHAVGEAASHVQHATHGLGHAHTHS